MRDKLDDAARHQYLSIIKEETDNLARLVDDLFLLTKLKQPSFTIQKSGFTFIHLFKEVQNRKSLFPKNKSAFLFTFRRICMYHLMKNDSLK